MKKYVVERNGAFLVGKSRDETWTGWIGGGFSMRIIMITRDINEAAQFKNKRGAEIAAEIANLNNYPDTPTYQQWRARAIESE